MKLNTILIYAAIGMTGLTGCKKYAEAPLMKDPAYIRVFNNLTTTVDFLHSQQVAPFLTFLADPAVDAAGVPSDAAVTGDFLGARQFYSLSAPINEANSSLATVNPGGNSGPVVTNMNYEYPGNAHVLAAPVINGLDLSAWAQFPSGKHRILFVVRPSNNIAFSNLSATVRSNILIDTTIDFQKGEVYTMEVVSRDIDNAKYGLYVRKEQFIHQAFETNKLYAAMVNLSGKLPASAAVSAAFFFPDKLRISYSYNILNDAVGMNQYNFYYDQLPGYDDTYYTTLNSKMDTVVSFLPLPLLPEENFFYQGVLRTYSTLPNFPSEFQGTMPYVNFNIVNADRPTGTPDSGTPDGLILACSADPTIFNNTPRQSYTPNLNLIVNTGNAFHVYPTLNILELSYDHVYLMQIQRGIDEIPKN